MTPEPRELEQEFLAALGDLLVQANHLEEALMDVYWLVSGKEWGDALADVRGMTLHPLRKHAIATFEAQVKNPALLAHLDGLKSELEIVVNLRNEFVHATWSLAADHVERKRRPRTGAVREEFENMTVLHVSQAAEFIGNAAERLWELFDAVGEADRAAGSRPRSRGGTVVDGVLILK